ncbi:phospholipase D-like domain-containing protein [Methylomonas sp. MK1]|uniref:phospholipase D-like domain-containing protein n=1 Tax=Methylomonas sp. MK1 TaxID=1131552 RepID=UPI00035F808D|nr:phospholipase D-like domain-containing protein [Methylomonas sp. MK1]
MRSEINISPKGLQVRAIAGTYVVLLAFTCPKAYCGGLLGFGIRREDHENGEVTWLRGLKRFDLPGDDGYSVSSRDHPIQKFHWGDYTTKPGRTYTYTIHALTGKPGALKTFESVAVQVSCEHPVAVGNQGHAVHFNRSAAASQAFASRFPHLPTGEIVDENARRWLSRGLEEALIAYIDTAKAKQGLHLFLYEFAKDAFFQALKRAKLRKVRLEILYDGLLDAKGDGPSLDALPQIKKYGLKSVCKARTGAGLTISHNKFMVLSNGKGQPISVWTGSTNFTDGAIYGQSNVGHVISDATVAKQYFDWHQAVWKSPSLPGADSRKIVMGLTQPPATTAAGSHLVLSPRKSTEAISECAEWVTASKRMICFTAPFAMHDELEAALVKAPAHVLGLLNTRSVVDKALHDAPNTQLAASAAINEKSTLEVWQGRLLAESKHHSGVHVHTKILLVDPLSDNPLVVTGSANFSTNSCRYNDENQLFIIGDTAVADVYLGEFMRMFDHYYFRDYSAWAAKQKKLNPQAGFLDGTDQWALRFFDGGEREAARLAFFG